MLPLVHPSWLSDLDSILIDAGSRAAVPAERESRAGNSYPELSINRFHWFQLLRTYSHPSSNLWELHQSCLDGIACEMLTGSSQLFSGGNVNE